MKTNNIVSLEDKDDISICVVSVMSKHFTIICHLIVYIYVVYILLKVFVLRTVVSETFSKWSSLYRVSRPFRHDFRIKFPETRSLSKMFQLCRYLTTKIWMFSVSYKEDILYIHLHSARNTNKRTNERATNLNQQPPPWKKKKDKALSSGIVIIILLCLHLKQQTTISQISNFWRHH